MTSLRGEVPDRVPVSLSIGPTNAKRWLGRDDWGAVLEAHKLVGSIPAQDFGMDYYTIDTNPLFHEDWPSGWCEISRTTPIPGVDGGVIKTREILTPQGRLTSRERLDRGEYIHGQTIEPLIKTMDDYRVYRSYLNKWLELVEIVGGLDDETKIEQHLGIHGVWVSWIIHSFYQYFRVLRRVDDFLMDFYNDSSLMKEILSYTWKLNEKFIQVFNASACPLLICNLSGASTSIISPGFFRQWILPELYWMVKATATNKYVGFHLTGKVREVLPLMMDAKPHTILRFESPRFRVDISLGEVNEQYGEKICIKGGYDPHTYIGGDRDAIRTETKRCIDQAADWGGYIIANKDHIPEEADLEDVKYMVDFARDYGAY